MSTSHAVLTALNNVNPSSDIIRNIVKLCQKKETALKETKHCSEGSEAQYAATMAAKLARDAIKKEFAALVEFVRSRDNLVQAEVNEYWHALRRVEYTTRIGENSNQDFLLSSYALLCQKPKNANPISTAVVWLYTHGLDVPANVDKIKYSRCPSQDLLYLEGIHIARPSGDKNSLVSAIKQNIFESTVRPVEESESIFQFTADPNQTGAEVSTPRLTEEEDDWDENPDRLASILVRSFGWLGRYDLGTPSNRQKILDNLDNIDILNSIMVAKEAMPANYPSFLQKVFDTVIRSIDSHLVKTAAFRQNKTETQVSSHDPATSTSSPPPLSTRDQIISRIRPQGMAFKSRHLGP